MEILSVSLGERSYPIYIGEKLLAQHPQQLLQHIAGSQVLVISNPTVSALYLDSLAQILQDHEFQYLELPDGEQYKNLGCLEKIYTRLLERRFARDCTLIALGGGVIGDITGFAAATYQRGVAYIQIPTTLLAQVDSSVGGKTAVNHRLGKNMLGAFYQPQCVIADIDTLHSLPERELSAGLAEVIKYGLIRDAEFFDWLDAKIPALLNKEPTALSHAIRRSCQNKADVVALDEREQGVRALLNLGHTFGHAIETFFNYQTYLHGEAVAIGIAMAARFSTLQCWLQPDATQRIIEILLKAKLPTQAPQHMQTEDFLQAMSRDKKVINRQIRLILLKSIGQAVQSVDYDNDLLNHFLATETSAADSN